MAREDEARGWWDAPAGKVWTCPPPTGSWDDGCGKTSLIVEWAVCEPYCEDCGEHDGRRCPRCGASWDHVWGSGQIAEATADPNAEPDPEEETDGQERHD